VRLRYAESFEARNAAMTVISPNLLLDVGNGRTVAEPRSAVELSEEPVEVERT
jgi:hypothetical protein